MKIKTSKVHLLFYVLFALAAFGLYSPAFFHEFGFHNDYSFLLRSGSFWTSFPETQHLLMIGRFLGSLLISLESHLFHNISDFAVARLVSLIVLLGLTFFTERFLRQHCKLEFFWSTAIVILFFFLPGNELNLLWSTNFVSGTLNLCLSFWGYILLSQANPGTPLKLLIRQKKIIAVFFIWLASFFIYPLTALFPAALIFASLLFSPSKEWLKTRTKTLNSIVLISAAMLSYVVIDRGILQPFLLPWMKLSKSMDILYTSDITFNPLEKISYIREILKTSLAGNFHMFSEDAAARVGASLLLILVLSRFLVDKTFASAIQDKRSLRQSLEKTLWLMFLFLLSICPLIIAKNYNEIGYRLLIVPSLMFILLYVELLRRIYFAAQTNALKIFIIIFMGLIIAGKTAGTRIHTQKVVRNHVKELDVIRGYMRSVDLNAVEIIVVICVPSRQNFSLTGDHFTNEFGFLTEIIDHVAPIIMEEMRRQNINTSIRVFCFENFDRKISDDKTLLIDLRKHSIQAGS